jgi:hypothetical protein
VLILQGSWRDGWRGWIIAATSMIAAFMKYAFIYEIRLNKKGSTETDQELL